jgi:hypothetical protein
MQKNGRKLKDIECHVNDCTNILVLPMNDTFTAPKGKVTCKVVDIGAVPTTMYQHTAPPFCNGITQENSSKATLKLAV